MKKLNALTHQGIASPRDKARTSMRGIQFLIFLGAALFLAACATEPTVDQQPSAVVEDVIDTANLAAYYPFDGSARDSSANGNHGTVHGGSFVPDRLGRPASAYAFNGADAYIAVPGTPSLDSDFEVSMSVWLYHKTQDSEQEWYSIVEKTDPERWGHSKYGLWLIRDLVELCVQPFDLEIPHRCIDSDTKLEPEQWHHLVGMSDGTVLRMYINGRLAGEKDFGSRMRNSKSHYEMYMGTDLYDAAPVYAKGAIDELRVYMRVLSEEEVMALYQAD